MNSEQAAASLAALGEGRFRVSGSLTFATVGAALHASARALADSGAETLEVDLADVRSADTAGLALLIEWFRQAVQANKTISFVGVPASLRALAKISDIDAILSLS